MLRFQVCHTADLTQRERELARGLLYDVFDDMTEEDWDHCLGGVHALSWDGDRLVGHAAVVQRQLIHKGRALRCGYVEGVAVRSDHRRQGIAGQLMREIERIIHAAYDMGALGSSDEGLPFYRARGWQPWRGPTSALTPSGVVRTSEEDGYIFVMPAGTDLDLDAEITCDYRTGELW